MRKVNITVDAIGGIKFDAEGFNGQGCLEATKVFENVFAGKQGPRNIKGEFYLPDDKVRETQRV